MANRLNRLVTLTYAGEGCHDPRTFRTDMASFVKRLRRELGEEPLPYAWVPEWHKSGHGLHAHVGLAGYVPKDLVERAWGHGFVDVRLLGGETARSSEEGARRASAYLSKYVGKDLGGGVEQGLHRYEVAQGFQPEAIQFAGRTIEHALAQASEHMGADPEVLWRPVDASWEGPPVMWARWKSAKRASDAA